jgi:seryl-tRNA synthetase
MHDPRAVLSSPHAVQRLERRNYHLDLDVLGTLVSGRAEAIAARDAARARLNSVARNRDGRQPGGPAPDDQAQAARDLKKEIRELEEAERQCQASLAGLLLTIPNLPLDEVPDGGAEDPPVVVRGWGAVPRFTFAPRDHVALGTATGVLDLVRASKLSGSRFSVTRGTGAHLERALSNFLLDLHTTEHGYTEHGLPHLVNRETMTGTGQLPKFAEDLFHTQNAGRELFLIPTAEVPLVNLYRDEILPEADLPLALTAHTACFRSEAAPTGAIPGESSGCTSSRRWSLCVYAVKKKPRRNSSCSCRTPRNASGAWDCTIALSICDQATWDFPHAGHTTSK